MNHFFTPILCSAVVLLLVGCGGDDGAGNGAAKNDSPSAQEAAAPAALSSVLVTSSPADPISVSAARSQPTVGESITVHGRVGGRVDPFITGKAAMIVADPDKLLACDANPGDACGTPWDFCCEGKAKIAGNTLMVQVPGADGRPLDHGLKGVGGLQPGSFVVVDGVVAKGSGPNSLIIDASGIYVDTDRKVEVRAGGHEGHEHHDHDGHDHDH